MIVRPLALVVAASAFGVGIAFLTGVAAMDVSVALVIVAGSIAFMGAVWSIAMRRGSGSRRRTPEPESARQVPVPGAELTGAVDQFRSWSTGHTSPSERTVEGLHGAAIAVLTRYRGLSPAAAENELEDGTWTDDPYAAGLLSTRLGLPDQPRTWRSWLLRVIYALPFRSLRVGLEKRVSDESAYEIAVRRTATALARISSEASGEDVKSATELETAPEDRSAPRTTDDRVDGVIGGRRLETGYWHGIGVVALLAVAVGMFAQSSAVVLAGAVGMGYAGASRLFDAPRPTIDVERTVEPVTPEPGEEVEVTVTVTNESGGLLPDVRFVDGVPGDLSVSDGSPRLGTALRASEAVSYSYTVTAVRGRHRFDPALVITRDPFQSVERSWHVGAETIVECDPGVKPLTAAVPLRPEADAFGSTIETGDSGPGNAFHSVREYRRGDPMNRIDWNRHARTGELATLEFDEERAARVLLLVDARREAYVAPEAGADHAVNRSVEACGRIAGSLLESGNLVGLAAVGPTVRDLSAADGVDQCWLAPGSGHNHVDRLRGLLANHSQLSATPPSASVEWMGQLRRIRRRLSGETQVVLFTPLNDDAAVEIARRLEAYGHPVVVVSPDPTADRTTSQQLAVAARRIRRFDLRRAGIPVIDWRAEETIDQALSRTGAGDRE
ncbi:DUF58 domain-containing protein [Halovivax sp.]|uniref:DUF58 domain-containing protein n=1 Tax=Halovivax sp. TaxID=1935978 RepID=UPI0025B85D18|nr:DUF58 domain-containing protein [Halovivax sp.]